MKPFICPGDVRVINGVPDWVDTQTLIPSAAEIRITDVRTCEVDFTVTSGRLRGQERTRSVFFVTHYTQRKVGIK